MNELRQEHQRKAKGNQSALKGSKESAIIGKHKDSLVHSNFCKHTGSDDEL